MQERRGEKVWKESKYNFRLTNFFLSTNFRQYLCRVDDLYTTAEINKQSHKYFQTFQTFSRSRPSRARRRRR